MEGKIKILLADDNDKMNEIQINNLQELDYIEICGIALNGKEEIKLIEEKQPDIVITDNQMPEMTGIEVIETITKDENIEKKPKFIIVSGDILYQYISGKNKNVIEAINKGIGIDRINKRIIELIEEQKENIINKPLVIENETILKLSFWERIKKFFKREKNILS